MMNDSLTADTRRFRLSLAASAFLNIGLLVLIGRLDLPATLSRPQARPHLRLVTLTQQPAPPDSGRRGVRTASRLTVPSAARPAAAQPRAVQAAPRSAHTPRRLPLPLLPHLSPTLTAMSAPALRLRVVTASEPSPRAVPRLVIPSSLASLHPLALPLPVLLRPLVKPTLVASAPPWALATDRVIPHVHQEVSRGTTGEGAGWTGGAGASTNRTAGGPFGIGDGLAADGVTRHIVYVLDTSGSMKSRLDRAEDELTEALRGLRPGETFNIVTFSGGSELFDPDMAEAAPGNIQRAAAFLSGLEAYGDTDLEDAVVRALMLRDVNEVVILTDGVPTVGETDPEKLAGSLRRFNLRHTRISTIGLVGKNPDGTDDSFAAAQLLQQIAHDSGGAAKLVSLGSATP